MLYAIIILILVVNLFLTWGLNVNTKKAGYSYNKEWYPISYFATTVFTLAVLLVNANLTEEIVLISLMIPALVVLSCIDFKMYIIPNRLNAYLAVLAIVYALVNIDVALALLIGGAIYFVLFLFLSIITGGNLGMGDVKMSFSMGVILGSTLLLKFLAYSFLLAGVVAALLLITKKKSANDKIAFGPYLVIGFIATIVFL